MVKDLFSIECEECNSYNISPVKCESCWRKQIKQEFEKMIDKRIDNFEKDKIYWREKYYNEGVNESIYLDSIKNLNIYIEILEELKQKLGEMK
jgi:hypothetical protein